MNIDTNTLIFIALAIMMILIVICFICNSINSSKINTLMDCENDSNISLKKVAVVNFDAFDDVTGKLSFALAILNNNNDGIILTSLYGHNSCNTYVREIVGGQTPIKLLDEENAALENAKSKLKRTENNG